MSVDIPIAGLIPFGWRIEFPWIARLQIRFSASLASIPSIFKPMRSRGGSLEIPSAVKRFWIVTSSFCMTTYLTNKDSDAVLFLSIAVCRKWNSSCHAYTVLQIPTTHSWSHIRSGRNYSKQSSANSTSYISRANYQNTKCSSVQNPSPLVTE